MNRTPLDDLNEEPGPNRTRSENHSIGIRIDPWHIALVVGLIIGGYVFQDCGGCGYLRRTYGFLSRSPGSEAEDWLELVDAGELPKAWSEASSLLRRPFRKEHWVEHIQRVRRPLGRVVERKLVEDKRRVVPVGRREEKEISSVTFATRFEHRPIAAELLTLSRDAEGIWRIDSYVVR